MCWFLGGRFCSFSPCIEQSQRCCIALQEQGFTEIQSYEILQQEDVVKTKTFPVMNLEFLKHKVKMPFNIVEFFNKYILYDINNIYVYACNFLAET